MRYRTTHGEVGMAVVIHGKEIAEFPHKDKTYIWARNGTEYSIIVWNSTSRRVEVVVTVDGLDIIKGKVGDYRNQSGYVIDAHSKPKPIPGFKRDDKKAARFNFLSPEESYAELVDKPNNVGVIGAAFFLEKERPSLFHENQHPALFRGSQLRGGGEGGNDLSYGLKSCSVTRGASIGTGYGREISFHTTKTSFVRENPNTPTALLALHYHTQEVLAEMGIDVRKKPKLQIADGPNPFPGTTDGCKPPSGWSPRG